MTPAYLSAEEDKNGSLANASRIGSNHYSAIQALRQLITELYHAGAQWMQ